MPVEDEALESAARAPCRRARAARPARPVAWAFAAAAPGREARLRADRGRRAARRALAHGARAARARPAGRAPDRRARRSAARARRSRRPARCTTACARSAGTRPVRPRPGDRRLGLAARARRHGGARLGARCARAGLRRRCSSRGCPRAISASAIAASPTTRSPCSTCCSSRSRSRCRPACARRWAPTCAPASALCSAARARVARRSRWTWSVRCGSRATTGAARRSTCPATPPAGLPARRWAAALAEDPLFFGAALAGGAALAELVAVGGMSFEALGGGRASTRARSSTCASSASATPTARRSRARSSATRAPWRSWPTTSTHVWLVRQPREAVGEPALLEIPAGRLDVEGEEPLAAAQRELAEEIGKGAERWEPIVVYYTGAGFTDERVHLFEATTLHEAQRRERGERAHRGRAVAARAPRRGDRRVPRREDADRPLLAGAQARSRLAAEHLTAAPDASLSATAERQVAPSGGWPRGEAQAVSTAHLVTSPPPASIAEREPPIPRGEIQSLLLDFLAYLELERGLSRNTLEAYRSDLLQFGAFLDAGARCACARRPTATSPRSSPSSPQGDGEPPAGARRRSSARSRACAPSTAICAARA